MAEYLGQPVNPPLAKNLFDDFGYAVDRRRTFTTLLELRLSLVFYHQFFTTSNGYIGWGPLGTQKGDFVCIVIGCSMLLILRKIDSRYIHIGSCFLLGIMDGVIFNETCTSSDTIQEFTII
ncbi:hypothetical protein BDV59DRAFT_177077 [Aspergillus ambiguus]|uniref:uncharacterized protein n=1 Tax=Aspergillus ambiguus TaxID=176160 RepID=UPI003CCE3064